MSYQNIECARKLCEFTHSLLPDFPLQYLRCLIFISKNEGASITGVSQQLAIPLSTASRILGALENNRQHGNPYQLVEINLEPSNRRQKVVFLSEKGKNFLQQLDEAMA